MDGGQNIWIMSLDGSDTIQVSEGAANRAESPEWTPDGDYIVASVGGYRSGGLPNLHLYHVDGGSGVELVEDDGEKNLGAAFGPDGRWIWYARRDGDWTYNAPMPQYQLAVYDRDTGETYARTARWGSGYRPTLSPDGRWLVYGTRHDAQTGLRIRDLETDEERWLAYPVQQDDQESRATFDVLPGMSFTPDSRALVASWGGKLWRVPIGDDGAPGDAEEIPFELDYQLAVGPVVDFDYPIEDTPTFVASQIRDPAPSPDGSRIAFTSMARLWVADADGSNAQRLTGTAPIDETGVTEHFPAWSPDGSRIAYVTWEGEAGHVYTVSADGGTPQRVSAEPASYVTPAWTPDGTRLVVFRDAARAYRESAGGFGSGSPDPTEIVWLPVGQGEAEATLVAPAENRSTPHFVEGSDRLYLYDGSDDALVSMRLDGTDERTHIRVSGPRPPNADEGLGPDAIMMAPVGDQAMASINGQLYTVTVPRVGAEPPTINVGNPDNAAFPARRLTDMGGEFPSWSSDGGTVHYALGNAFFSHDLAAADADSAYTADEVRVEIEVERDIPEGTVVLRGATVLTMVGEGAGTPQVIQNADVVVTDNRIAAVGAQGEVDVPAGAEVRDVSGRYILPGFVDIHAHMRPSYQVHRTDVWSYMANLAYGVTTTRDAQPSTSDHLTYADRVTAGELLGPRIYSTGRGVFWETDIDSLEKARDILRKYAEYYDTKTLKMYVSAPRKGRQYIIMAALELGLMPTTEGSLNIRQNLDETLDGYPGLEHSVPIFPIYDDVIELFVEQQRTYTPTLLVSYGGPWAENWFYENDNPHDDERLRRFIPHEVIDAATLRRAQWFREDQYHFEEHAEFVRDLVEAGGRAGVGSHGQLQGLGYHWELWAMASAGMDPMDALSMATRLGAEAIGLDQDIGTIEPGKLADLVILEADPRTDLRNTERVEGVMMNGRLFDAATMTETWPRQREIQPLWWWDGEPIGLPGVGAGR
jgi:imidazolonepropionase-like amidohydrolase/Tol biopolymer transport system component